MWKKRNVKRKGTYIIFIWKKICSGYLWCMCVSFWSAFIFFPHFYVCYGKNAIHYVYGVRHMFQHEKKNKTIKFCGSIILVKTATIIFNNLHIYTQKETFKYNFSSWVEHHFYTLFGFQIALKCSRQEEIARDTNKIGLSQAHKNAALTCCCSQRKRFVFPDVIYLNNTYKQLKCMYTQSEYCRYIYIYFRNAYNEDEILLPFIPRRRYL